MLVSRIPPMVRILPMNKIEEFYNWDIDQVQKDYFLKELPYERKGEYLYRERSINALKGSIILFQYDGKIIALAEFIEAKEFPQPVNGMYRGAYYFDSNSIVVFDPISDSEIRTIWAGFKRFSNTKQFLDPTEYPQFLKFLKTRNMTLFNIPSTKGKFGGGGEGEEHRNLKIWLSQNPDKLRLKNVVSTEIEHRFLSGDSADLIFTHKGNRYTIVEVETNIPLPGAHQAIKYRALLCAEKKFPLDTKRVQAILVAWFIPKDVELFCKTYGINYCTHRLQTNFKTEKSG